MENSNISAKVVFFQRVHPRKNSVCQTSAHILFLRLTTMSHAISESNSKDEAKSSNQVDYKFCSFDVVRVEGLKSKASWNGLLARVISFDKNSNRYAIELNTDLKTYLFKEQTGDQSHNQHLSKALLKKSNLILAFPFSFAINEENGWNCFTCNKSISKPDKIVECHYCYTIFYCSDACRIRHQTEYINGLPTKHSSKLDCHALHQCMLDNSGNYQRFQPRQFNLKTALSILTQIRLLFDSTKNSTYWQKIKDKNSDNNDNKSTVVNNWNDFFNHMEFKKIDKVHHICDYFTFAMTMYFILQKWDKLSKLSSIRIHVIGAENKEASDGMYLYICSVCHARNGSLSCCFVVFFFNLLTRAMIATCCYMLQPSLFSHVNCSVFFIQPLLAVN